MSVQFGKCNLDGEPINPADLDQVRPVLAPYGPDGEGMICRDNVGILYRAFHTTKESRREIQPHACRFGPVVTWDGRLDNRQELVKLLQGQISFASTDLEIVATAFERWGTNLFSKLLGDWALSIWDPKKQHLLLARDVMGIRHLYYLVEKDRVAWSTILDPLVVFAGHTFELEEKYIAGWLSSFPAPHLTPYAGILACPPSSFVRLAKGLRQIHKYWELDRTRTISYPTDSDYEKHFRTLFAESVRRRLRSDSPVLAELSGGVDSSSIVCMADRLSSNGLAEVPRLDTVSYFDDSERNWNELPYFSEVESRRGKEGLHIDVSSQPYFQFRTFDDVFMATPASTHRPSVADQTLRTAMQSRGNRTLLSGIGGDEFMGGVPSFLPELADHLVRGQLIAFFSHLKSLALYQRKPCLHLLMQVVRSLLPRLSVGSCRRSPMVPWLSPKLIEKYPTSPTDSEPSFRIWRGLPTFQDNLCTLEHVRRQMEFYPLPENPVYERRYPYLDRDLLEFVCAIPREQLVRPGERRSLMRRALADTTPESILNRKRKAFVARRPAHALWKEEESIRDMTENMLAASMGILDGEQLKAFLNESRVAAEIPVMQFFRTLELECWLRSSYPRFISHRRSARVGRLSSRSHLFLLLKTEEQ